MDSSDESVPRARAGHCAVGIHSRLYVWSGRDGYRKAWNNQVRVSFNFTERRRLSSPPVPNPLTNLTSVCSPLPNFQVCCKDLWYLEVSKPPAPSRVQLVRASTNSLEVSWTPTIGAQYYILQIQKYDMPPVTAAFPSVAPTPTPTPATNPPPPPTIPISTPPLTTAASTPTPVTPLRPAIPQTTPLRLQTPPQIPSPRPITSPLAAKPMGTPMAARITGNLVRIRSPLVTSSTSLPATSLPPTSVLSPQIPDQSTPSSPQNPSAMSGIAALAAAAAATPKISMNNVPIIHQGTPNTIRMKTVQAGQQIRFAPPGSTVLRTGNPTQSKQIILQKPGQNLTGQAQIVHLVKTGQGMMATMPKVSLMPGKTVQGAGGKPIAQGPTILRLVNPNSVAGLKTLTTMKGSSLMTMSKAQNIAGKQTIMITKPGGNGGLVGRTNQIIVVTTGSGLRAVQAVTTSQAGAGQGNLTTPVNVLPLSAANHVTNQQGVKMIVVSSGAMGGGTSGKPITITVPGQGGVPKTVTIATKSGQPTLFNPGKSQIVTMPQIQKGQETMNVTGKPVTLQMGGLGSKTVTLMPTSASIVTSTADSIDTSKMVFVPQKQPSASLASTSDGPATTDAALAALAAEAGLIDPVQEPSGGLSFMIGDDPSSTDDKIDDSCNGNEAAATAALVSQLTAGEPMQIDSEGNFVIPQVDGAYDLLTSDEEEDAETPEVNETTQADSMDGDSQDTEMAGPASADDEQSVEEDPAKVEEREERESTDAADSMDAKATGSVSASGETESAAELDNQSSDITADGLSEAEPPSDGDMQIISNPPSAEASVKSETSAQPVIEPLPVPEKVEIEAKVDNLENGEKAETVEKGEEEKKAEEEKEPEIEEKEEKTEIKEKGEKEETKAEVDNTIGADDLEKVKETREKSDAEALLDALEDQSFESTDEKNIENVEGVDETKTGVKRQSLGNVATPEQIKAEPTQEPMDEDRDEEKSVTNGDEPVECELEALQKAMSKEEIKEDKTTVKKEVIKEENESRRETNDDSTALSTLATAALGSAEQPVKVKAELVSLRWMCRVGWEEDFFFYFGFL